LADTETRPGLLCSPQTDLIDGAMAKAQRDMKAAAKDAVNPHFKSKYADLAAVWDAIRVPLTSNGIAVLQNVENIGEAVAVTTRLVHAGQFYEFGPLVVPLAQHTAHGIGSAITYGKRYSLSAAVGVATDEDDDGNAAVGKGDRVDRDDNPIPETSDLPPCPNKKCKAVGRVIVSKYGPGFYCLACKTKWDPVKDEILANGEPEDVPF
jgi:hypothetical protein